MGGIAGFLGGGGKLNFQNPGQFLGQSIEQIRPLTGEQQAATRGAFELSREFSDPLARELGGFNPELLRSLIQRGTTDPFLQPSFAAGNVFQNLGLNFQAPEVEALPFFGGLGQAVPEEFQNFGNLPGVSSDPSDAALRAERQTFARARNLLDPQFEAQTRGLENQLTNIGIPRGSELRDEEMRKLRLGQNEALSQAARAAVREGQARQSEEFRQQLANRQRAFGEQLTGRQQALGEALQAIQSQGGAQQQDFANQLTRSGFFNQARRQELEDRALAENRFANRRLLQLQALAPLLQRREEFTPVVPDVFGGALNLAGGAAGLQAQAAQQNQAARSRGIGSLFDLGATFAPLAFGGPPAPGLDFQF